MAEYTIFYNQMASTSVSVEADTLDDAIDFASAELPGELCAQCSGWNRSVGIDLSGDWELDEESLKNDYPEEAGGL